MVFAKFIVKTIENLFFLLVFNQKVWKSAGFQWFCLLILQKPCFLQLKTSFFMKSRFFFLLFRETLQLGGAAPHHCWQQSSWTGGGRRSHGVFHMLWVRRASPRESQKTHERAAGERTIRSVRSVEGMQRGGRRTGRDARSDKRPTTTSRHQPTESVGRWREGRNSPL